VDLVYMDIGFYSVQLTFATKQMREDGIYKIHVATAHRNSLAMA